MTKQPVPYSPRLDGDVVVLGRSTVRYLKNGRGGQWWDAARARNQAHCGWNGVPGEQLERGNRAEIEATIRGYSKDQGAATRDVNQLFELLDSPSRHIWITFQDGCMWWCTLRNGLVLNADGASSDLGHFWLACDRPWSNHSLGGRLLSMTDLSGRITSTAAFRDTVCTPKAEAEILRVVSDQKDELAIAVEMARDAYELTIEQSIQRLSPQDFEHLVDLILVRTGWARISTLGSTREGIDLEVENAAADEVAFVQVKSAATQAVLDDYAERFAERRERYSRMIFAVHTPRGDLCPPEDVQVWAGRHTAKLTVRVGLGEWVEGKVA